MCYEMTVKRRDESNTYLKKTGADLSLPLTKVKYILLLRINSTWICTGCRDGRIAVSQSR